MKDEHCFHIYVYKSLAGGEGIGPSFTASKAAVLPLDDPPIFYYSTNPTGDTTIEIGTGAYINA